MTMHELEDYLTACGLQLDYARAYNGYRWLVRRRVDALPVGQGSDSDETMMIAHILGTPYQGSGALLGQVRVITRGALRGYTDEGGMLEV